MWPNTKVGTLWPAKISDHAEKVCTIAYLSLASVLNKTKFNMADTWFQCYKTFFFDADDEAK